MKTLFVIFLLFFVAFISGFLFFNGKLNKQVKEKSSVQRSIEKPDVGFGLWGAPKDVLFVYPNFGSGTDTAFVYQYTPGFSIANYQDLAQRAGFSEKPKNIGSLHKPIYLWVSSGKIMTIEDKFSLWIGVKDKPDQTTNNTVVFVGADQINKKISEFLGYKNPFSLKPLSIRSVNVDQAGNRSYETTGIKATSFSGRYYYDDVPVYGRSEGVADVEALIDNRGQIFSLTFAVPPKTIKKVGGVGILGPKQAAELLSAGRGLLLSAKSTGATLKEQSIDTNFNTVSVSSYKKILIENKTNQLLEPAYVFGGSTKNIGESEIYEVLYMVKAF